jgi:hypothetical protein
MAPGRWYRAATAELDTLADLVDVLEAVADGDNTVLIGPAQAAFNAARKRSLVELDRSARAEHLVTKDEFDVHCAAMDALAVRGAAAAERIAEQKEADRPSLDELATIRARGSAGAADRRAERIAAHRRERASRPAVSRPTAPVLDLGRLRTRRVEHNRLAEAIADVHLAVGDAARVDALHVLRRAALDAGDADYAAWARKELRHAGTAAPRTESTADAPGERVTA